MGQQLAHLTRFLAFEQIEDFGTLLLRQVAQNIGRIVGGHFIDQARQIVRRYILGYLAQDIRVHLSQDRSGQRLGQSLQCYGLLFII